MQTDKTQISSKLKDLHIAFIQDKFASTDTIMSVAKDAWTWLGKQAFADFVSLDMLQQFASEHVLAHAASEVLRADIRLIAQAAIDHPANADTQVGALIDDAQVSQLAKHISAQKAQREALIHEVIGNSGFATMLSQTISHAITDYLDNNLSKVAGVGKLVKFGKGALEKATSSNLNDGLNSYLNKNITNLTAKTESIAKKHLDDARIEAIILDAWQRVKYRPVSDIKAYLDDDSVSHAEQLSFDGFNHLRKTDFLQAHVRDHIATWYAAHEADTFADLFTALHIGEEAVVDTVNDMLAPLMVAVSQSDWFTQVLETQLSEFYTSQAVSNLLG